MLSLLTSEIRLRARRVSAFFRVVLPAFQAARQAGKQLQVIHDRTAAIRRNHVVLFCVLRNEAFRFPFFLNYYRSLGVGHFIFVDNGSNDKFADLVSEMTDVSVWRTEDSYKDARFGIDWINYLLRKYGAGHWCLVVDPDELLVYPFSDQRPLPTLTAYLFSKGREHLPCLLLDMYAASGMSPAPSIRESDPRLVCPFFDGTGYRFANDPVWRATIIRGGLRERVFFSDDPEASPALSKTPLVFWRRNFVYLSSTHLLTPARLNTGGRANGSDTSGVLLHFKFVAGIDSKISEEMHRRQHFSGGTEYDAYAKAMGEATAWMSARTVRYNSPQSLVDCGLMRTGGWS